ncbi:MAG TPA: DUF1997 domain-containing protein [Xenococcaceae cyanobacterium]|jgi:hypothetical protein
MKFNFTSHQQDMTFPVSDGELNLANSYSDRHSQDLESLDEINLATSFNPFLFQGSFLGAMDMYSDRHTVAQYLDTHEGWFCRCAKPMQVEPLGGNGYVLSVGKFNSLGYEVEPKIAIVLNPPKNGKYIMHTVPIPGDETPGYNVVYQAVMELQELDLAATLGKQIKHIFKNQTPDSTTMTRVSWTLDLSINVVFPKFIYKLPNALIQKTGDRLLAQIVRQISPRLTYKVQQDFHHNLNIPVPPKSGRKFEKIAIVSPKKQDCAA